MKKLLLAALLAVGATSFGAEVIEMPGTQGNTTTKLPIAVRGRVIENTGMQIVITPTVASSADGRSLDLNFGDIQKTTSNKIPMKAGEFEIQVTNNGNPVKFYQAPTVALEGGEAVGGKTGVLHQYVVNNTKNEQLVTLNYEYSGALSGEKLFKGRVEVTPDMKGNTGTGIFSATAVNLSITIANQTAEGAQAGA